MEIKLAELIYAQSPEDSRLGYENRQRTLAEILDEMVKEIRLHTILGPYYAEAVALWTLHAHGIAGCQFSPRLNLRSPEAECGKTTLLRIIQAFCEVRGAKIDSSITAAAYFRAADRSEDDVPPIMLLDEIDNFLDSDRKDAFSILNSGHHRDGAYVRRCDPGPDGKYIANQYCTWAPCVLAGIGEFSGNSKQIDALKSRCVIINLKRKKALERVEHFDDAAKARCIELGRQAVQWCQQNALGLRCVYPEIPRGLYNREADSWQTLFKFADAAGGRWPALAREAALALSGRSEDPSEGIQLLRDIRNAFSLAGADRLPTVHLLGYLHDCRDRPWGKRSLADTEPAFQDRQLAAALKPFDIRPKPIRIWDGTVPRGYTRDQFEDAWERYLPPEEHLVAEAKAA